MIAEALAAHAKAIARTFEGRENTVGASEVGQCARKIFFAKSAGDSVYGAASDEDYSDTWGAALRGRLFEDHFWVPALRAKFGDKLLYAGDEQKTLVSEFCRGRRTACWSSSRAMLCQSSASMISAATAH